ncbi:hypothetical protein GGR57DRAFT_82780 [Xylariaceae sp. FL1272]|nr:hypothetical protein GGR57DRAFT_82780 [Xylariaceae sp. FL1272]
MLRSIRKSFKSKKNADPSPQQDRSNTPSLQPVKTAISAYPLPGPDDDAESTSTTTLPAAETSSQRSRTIDRKQEPLGLHILHEPEGQRAIDVIFVHGLGGTSRLSWSWNRDLNYFWPKEWLPLEPELRDARILTFGYNAHFMSQKGDLFNITDFAKDLLLQMKFGSDSNVRTFDIGKVPILFVVHSMGGLVVKKAYILGCHDPQYQDIVKTVCSIVFLATPHRGSGLAEILNRFLQISTVSPKQYVTDLQKNSTRIRDINDQFRLHAPRMQIVSFFETMQTAVGPRKMIVVERESAILDYPDEISSPLTADHHTVCKYTSPEDSNYISVRNVISSMVKRFKHKATGPVRRKPSDGQLSAIEGLNELIGIDDWSAQDLDLLLERCVAHSCQWIVSTPEYRTWINDTSSKSTFLHITGHPGSGKSILAAFLVTEIKSYNYDVQYFFFKHDDQHKRSARRFILTLVYQIASQLPTYRERLEALLENRSAILKSDARTLWQKLVVGLLLKVLPDRPIVWIVDALDEAENSQLILTFFQSLTQQSFAIRVMFLSRPNTVARSVERLKWAAGPQDFQQITMLAPDESLLSYIRQELQLTNWDTSLKEQVTASLLSKSNGNFLWLFLVMKELVDCDTESAVELALSETPAELSAVYGRIERTLSADLRPEDIRLAKAILHWITCSERQLTLDELKEALQPHHPVLDMRHTISKLCGDFVAIDKSGKLSMVHHTAKEFLLQSRNQGLSINPIIAHEALLHKCLDVLLDPKFRYRLRSSGCHGFMKYACVSWSYHLSKAGRLDKAGLTRLASVFNSQAVLVWINAIGLVEQLKVLTNTAKALTNFLEKRKRADFEDSPLAYPAQEIGLCSQWASELVRLVGKFGIHITAHPQAIYSLIPAFCPPDSAIYRQFASQDTKSPRVTGFMGTGWDDSLAKFSVGYDCQPTQVICLPGYFGILADDETVNLYHQSTFQEARKFLHDGLILAITFDQEGKHLATCGARGVTIWDVLTGRVLYTFDNPVGLRAVSTTFSRESTQLMLCCDDASLWSRPLSPYGEQGDWEKIHRDLHDDPSFGGGRGTPICTAFSPDGNQIAISFRGVPLCIWSVETGQLIGRCERAGEKAKNRRDLWSYAQRLQWNPITEHLVGIYNDGCVFKWYPLESESEENGAPIIATEIACSPDGRLVVTASGNGSLRVWSFDNFTLLYHLSCTSSVTDIAVSLDGRRIYDLRESYCNVWEPNALVRLAEADEKASETSSSHAASITLSLASEASAVVLEPITALAPCNGTVAYCACNDAGTLIYVNQSGARSEISLGFMGITQVSWNDDNTLLATAELDGSVNVRIAPPNDAVKKMLEARSANSVQQLLFIDQDTKILVRDTQSTTVWSLHSKTAVSHRPANKESIEWIQHPSFPKDILAIGAQGITVHDIDKLSPKAFFPYDRTDHESLRFETTPLVPRRPSTADLFSRTETETALSKVLRTPDSSVLLIQFTRNTDLGHLADVYLLLRQVKLSTIRPDELQMENQGSLDVQPLPRTVLSQITMPLGFVDDDLVSGFRFTKRQDTHDRLSLAYLDSDFWVCTWPLGDLDGDNITKHFFLPRDWVNMDCLELATMTMDGRLLCPRNGEVAVVWNGLSWTEHSQG